MKIQTTCESSRTNSRPTRTSFRDGRNRPVGCISTTVRRFSHSPRIQDGRVLMYCSLDRAGDRRTGSEPTALQSPHRCPIGDGVQGPVDMELESPDGVRQADFRASRRKQGVQARRGQNEGLWRQIGSSRCIASFLVAEGHL